MRDARVTVTGRDARTLSGQGPLLPPNVTLPTYTPSPTNPEMKSPADGDTPAIIVPSNELQNSGNNALCADIVILPISVPFEFHTVRFAGSAHAKDRLSHAIS